MLEEEAAEEEQVFEVPFRVKNQDIPSVVGKAMDEWTKEDVARMEAEAEKEIEANFPSYFDEIQNTFFTGTMTKDHNDEDHDYRAEEVDYNGIFGELLGVTKPTESSYVGILMRDRLELVSMI